MWKIGPCSRIPIPVQHQGGLTISRLRRLIEDARALRLGAIDCNTTTVFRIANSDGDGLPGFFVDRYGHWAVSIECREKDDTIRTRVYGALMDAWDLKGIYEKGPARAGYHPGQAGEDEPVMGEAAPAEFVVRENGMALVARLREGAKPGVYPDQRENRLYLQPLMKGAKVLNLFSYTGAFSVWAALCGAGETVSVDLSKRVLEWSRLNFEANNIGLAAHRHVKADAFDYLGLARRKGFRFDLVILDPPTFSTNRRGLFRAQRDWPRLIAAACKVLERGGRLAISSNTHHISKREMLALIGAGIDGKRRHVVKPETVLGLPADFPVSPKAPEAHTLQFIVTRPISAG